MSDTTANVDHLRQATRRAQTRQSAERPSIATCALVRGFSFCLGAALFVTSVGLWAFASPDVTIMLIKVGASIVFLGGSAFLLQTAIAPRDPYHLEFDPSAQEFRVLEEDETGRFFVQSTHALGDVEKLLFEGGALRAWGADGTTVMAVPMRARSARKVIDAVFAATSARRTAG